MKLIYTETGTEVRVGDVVRLRDGEKVVVEFFRQPHKPSSSGKVCVKDIPKAFDRTRHSEYYVGVIGAEWIEREDQA